MFNACVCDCVCFVVHCVSLCWTTCVCDCVRWTTKLTMPIGQIFNGFGGFLANNDWFILHAQPGCGFQAFPLARTLVLTESAGVALAFPIAWGCHGPGHCVCASEVTRWVECLTASLPVLQITEGLQKRCQMHSTATPLPQRTFIFGTCVVCLTNCVTVGVNHWIIIVTFHVDCIKSRRVVKVWACHEATPGPAPHEKSDSGS